MQPGPSALRLTRLPPEDIEQGGGVRIDMAFVTKSRKKATKHASNIENEGSVQMRQPKRKRKRSLGRSDASVDSGQEGSATLESNLQATKSYEWRNLQQRGSLNSRHKEDENKDDALNWTFTLHETSAQSRIIGDDSSSSHRRFGKKVTKTSIANEVFVLSSDSE